MRLVVGGALDSGIWGNGGSGLLLRTVNCLSAGRLAV